MPYITEKDRPRVCYVDYTNSIPMLKINLEQIYTAGEMQYAIAEIIKSYIERKGLNYQHCNDIMGALIGAQMEFYRKVVGPYESKKEEQNGPVY